MNSPELIRLSILIVTYNSSALIANLLDHLQDEMRRDFNFGSDKPDAEVILLDNASLDFTATIVSTEYSWVKLIKSNVNLGFAAANNLAAKQAKGQYVLLLNPDAIPQHGSMLKGLEMMVAHPDAGLAGGPLISPEGAEMPSGRMFPSLMDEFFRVSGLAFRFPLHPLFGRQNRTCSVLSAPCKVDWIPGACVFIPAQVFSMLGGFDERFFMYYEEVDFCKRLKLGGMNVYHWPELTCMHIGGASAQTHDPINLTSSGGQIELWRMYSYFLYFYKYQGSRGAILAFLLEWGWCGLRRLKASLKGRRTDRARLDLYASRILRAWRDTAGGKVSPQRPWLGHTCS
jgi:GT2 family glycosyltransferase